MTSEPGTWPWYAPVDRSVRQSFGPAVCPESSACLVAHHAPQQRVRLAGLMVA
jgi:hypothetical protein